MAKMVCTLCGYAGQPRTTSRGSIGLEIFLWLLLFVPGMLYSLWRLTSKEMDCPKCRNNMVYPKSRAGKKTIEEYKIDIKSIPFSAPNVIPNMIRILLVVFGVAAISSVFIYRPSLDSLTLFQTYSPTYKAEREVNSAATVTLAGLNTAVTDDPAHMPIILTVTNNMTEDLSAMGGIAVFRAPDNTLLATMTVSTACSIKASTTGFVKTQGAGDNLVALVNKNPSEYSFSWQPVEYIFIDGYKMSIQ